MHFAVTGWSFTDTGTGGKIIVTTDKVCHLTKKWKTKTYTRKFKWRIIRGLKVFCDAIFYLRKPWTMAQQEPGDTLIHTFIQDPWPACETHWFYFIGSVGSSPSRSQSALFQYHRTAPPYGPPVTIKFYPDKHPEVTSVDGYLERSISVIAGEPWSTLRLGAGTGAYPSGTLFIIGFAAARDNGKWYAIVRSILLFDTSSIPVGSLIISATLNIRYDSKYNTGGWLAKIGVYQSHPASNTHLVPSDYNQIEETLLSNSIAYADWTSVGFNVFSLNATGLALIIPGGITKLALRESVFDAPNVPPTWYSGYKYLQFRGKSADTADPIDRPYLEVTYQPKL